MVEELREKGANPDKHPSSHFHLLLEKHGGVKEKIEFLHFPEVIILVDDQA